MARTTPHHEPHEDTHRLRDDLATMRDEIRVKLHLAGMDAKREWARLDPQIRKLERLFGRGGPLTERSRRTYHEVEKAMRDILHRRLPQPRVADVMTASPRCCGPDDPLAAAARVMREDDCGLVPVVDDDGKPLGVVTDRDLGLALSDASASAGRLSDVASPHVVAVQASDPLDVAAHAMIDHAIRRVVVTDDDGRVEGVVALADLALHCHDRALVDEVLTAVSAPRIGDQATPSAEEP